MRTLLILAFLTFFANLQAKHPTHLSVVNMELDAVNLKINYSIRLFQDDINYLISNLYHEELFHSTDTFDFEKNTYKLEAYFANSLEVILDQQHQVSKLSGREFSEMEFWLHFSIDLKNIPKTIAIRNKILIDYYRDQVNLLIFSYNEKEKGLTFSSDNTFETIFLEKM